MNVAELGTAGLVFLIKLIGPNITHRMGYNTPNLGLNNPGFLGVKLKQSREIMWAGLVLNALI